MNRRMDPLKIGYLSQVMTVLVFSVGILLVIFSQNILVEAAGIVIAAAGILSFLVLTGRARIIPLPAVLKRYLLINIIMRSVLAAAGIAGIDRDEVIRYFMRINNRMNGKPSGLMLILLPRCLQSSTCGRDLLSGIGNCIRCGNCQIAGIAGLENPGAVEVRFVGGGTQAIKEIGDIKPDSIVAVACESELLDGIKRIVRIPVWAVRNLRPNGPCRDTEVDLDELNRLIVNDITYKEDR